jgi:hypothetical protein
MEIRRKYSVVLELKLDAMDAPYGQPQPGAIELVQVGPATLDSATMFRGTGEGMQLPEAVGQALGKLDEFLRMLVPEAIPNPNKVSN